MATYRVRWVRVQRMPAHGRLKDSVRGMELTAVSCASLYLEAVRSATEGQRVYPGSQKMTSNVKVKTETPPVDPSFFCFPYIPSKWQVTLGCVFDEPTDGVSLTQIFLLNHPSQETLWYKGIPEGSWSPHCYPETEQRDPKRKGSSTRCSPQVSPPHSTPLYKIPLLLPLPLSNASDYDFDNDYSTGEVRTTKPSATNPPSQWACHLLPGRAELKQDGLCLDLVTWTTSKITKCNISTSFNFLLIFCNSVSYLSFFSIFLF